MCVEVLQLQHSLVWCQNLHTSESGSEVQGRFLNVMLRKNGEDQLEQSREK
jgi:hypothetical protein